MLMRRSRTRLVTRHLALLALIAGLGHTAPTATATPTPGPSGGLSGAPPTLSAAQVLAVLDQTVDWYRTLGLQQQTANEPSELLILYDNRQTANKVIGLAFDVARDEADRLSQEQPAVQDGGGEPGLSVGSLQQLHDKLDGQGRSVQKELDQQRHAAASAGKKGKSAAQAKVNELQGELDLVNTKKAIVEAMRNFVIDAGESRSGSLKAQIDAMAVAIPAAAAPNAAAAPAAGNAAPGQAPAAAAAVGVPVSGFGLWDLAANVFRLSEKSATLTSVDKRTAALQTAFAQIRAPLLEQIKALSARGDALGAKADTADSGTLNGVHDELDRLAESFKQTSALLIPLSREGILLSQYRRNLANWRDVIHTQTRDALATLAIRLGLLLALLALLFGAAELWRRTVLRYIQDSRRRYQLLLLRRIVLWTLVIVTVGVSFASELGSVVTFAGLLTAGIAVAMQSVLVSIVGYFFLIGKYGIRVGDRVQIGEVAGEVIELGMVRMYLMELGQKGTMGPTGRVVAFANSVVFQVASGLFKQIPGVDFSWREITLPLPPGADYAAIKEALTTAMQNALKDYRDELLRQTRELERATLSTAGAGVEPQVQLHFSAVGVEALIRYPVHLAHAAEIDERVTEALAGVVSRAAPGSASALPVRTG